MEDRLDVKVTTREGWVKLEGEPEKSTRPNAYSINSNEAQKKGVPIQKHEFQYALNSVSESRDDNLSDAVSMKITRLRASRPSWRVQPDNEIISRRSTNTTSFLESDRPAPAKLIWRSQWQWPR